ncbi:GntR family transcriptional regulator [Flexivirga caeni]|uniref:GntR family transcriptional regulator n=1 Tax=Flexivirga caeni TaxID=2294115 RepID=A0A3M9M8R1_9MICO|nr:GntR family transcriptional regulator [Flexivirga caeni]RNI21273.1 GntR family transcriptional regulator [Flexivirga caeni]
MTSVGADDLRLRPVVRESTAVMIADQVRDAIERGDLRPGAQLGEAELARQLGVSRGPLREGLQRLTQEGLLLSIRNRGLFVIEMTPDRVRDMYTARQAVERAAAEQIHLADPHEAGTELLTIADTMQEMVDADDATGMGEADIAFHDLLVRLAGSPRLSRMHRTLLTETRMGIHALGPTYRGDDARVAEHREIAQSFVDRDPERTDRLLRLHMADAVTRLTHGRNE